MARETRQEHIQYGMDWSPVVVLLARAALHSQPVVAPLAALLLAGAGLHSQAVRIAQGALLDQTTSSTPAAPTPPMAEGRIDGRKEEEVLAQRGGDEAVPGSIAQSMSIAGYVAMECRGWLIRSTWVQRGGDEAPGRPDWSTSSMGWTGRPRQCCKHGQRCTHNHWWHRLWQCC